MEVKVGDLVHVKGKVCGQSKDGFEIDFGLGVVGSIEGTWVHSKAIAHVEPAPIKVGNTVSHENRDWLVLGVDGDVLWLKNVSGHILVDRDQVKLWA